MAKLKPPRRSTAKSQQRRYSNPQRQQDALAELIRGLIDETGGSQTDFALLLSKSLTLCTQAWISTWVTGSRCVPSERLTRIAELCELDDDRAATDFVMVAALSNLRRALERDERCGEYYDKMCQRLQVAAWNAMIAPARRLGVALKPEKYKGRPRKGRAPEHE